MVKEDKEDEETEHGEKVEGESEVARSEKAGLGGGGWWWSLGFDGGTCCYCEEGLKFGLGFFLISDDGFDFGEAGGFQHRGQAAFGEAEPAICVECAGLGELVLEEIEDDDAAAGLENFEGCVDGCLRIFCMMEGLAEDGEVDGFFLDGGGFDIADAEFQVMDAVCGGEFLGVFDHFW